MGCCGFCQLCLASSLFQIHPAPGRLLLSLPALVLFVFIYTWFMWPHPLSRVTHARNRSHLSLALIILLTMLALGLSLLADPNFFWLFICVSAITGIALPVRSAIVVIVLLMVFTALVGAEGIKANWDQAVLPLVLLVRGLGLDMMGLTRLFAALQECTPCGKNWPARKWARNANDFLAICMICWGIPFL